MTDLPRLRKVIDYVLTLPDASTWCERDWEFYEKEETGDVWAQATWVTGTRLITESGVIGYGSVRCGTAACVAGHTVLMFGEPGTVAGGRWVALPDGREQATADYAAELLSLDPSAKISLFKAGNTADTLRRILADIETREEGTCHG